ncbi:MAG: oligosaccharide flippase family protein [Methanomassiliicoccus sp.]|nr:oligosaccharide flippase family protein [Methanomassiliicoccus sp.]
MLPRPLKNVKKYTDSISLSEIKRSYSNPFYSNTTYIILSSMMGSTIGLIYWIIAARYYPEETVGVATAIISLIGLIVSISLIGLDQSLIRYFPDWDKSKIVTTTLLITSTLSALMGLFTIEFARYLSPSLTIIDQSGTIIFLIFVILQCSSGIMSNAFIAMRKARYTFIQTIIMSSRLILLVVFISLGVAGILLSWALSYAIASLVAIYLLYELGIRIKKIDYAFVKESFGFSIGIYVFGNLNSFPLMILPLLVLNLLGAVASANYYIASSFAMIASIIISACNTSLFVEGSHGERLKESVFKSLLASTGLLIPLTIGVYLGGGFLLSLLGKSYATGGFELLKLLLIANLFNIPYGAYYTILKIQKNIKRLIELGALNCIFTLGLCYLLMQMYGLNGIGYASILANGIEIIIILPLMMRGLV